VSSVFSRFMINGLTVEFVQEFRYLGYILSCKMRDDSGIKREIRNMYMRTNMLSQRFKCCSINVRLEFLGFIAYAYMLYLYGQFWPHGLHTAVVDYISAKFHKYISINGSVITFCEKIQNGDRRHPE